jgi:DNA repair protein RecN (Recombination protein N)
MLTELRIQNFAIIDELTLSLSPGFVVFTGETGAGKSIIIDAVELLLGGRADNTMVRTGAEVALIEGVFHLEPTIQEGVAQILEREGLLDDIGYCVLAREIRREGRNICRINGRTVNLGLLTELGGRLVDVHGQSEHLSLLRVKEHLHLLDRFAQDESILASYRDSFHLYLDIYQELEELKTREQDAARRTEFLTYQINEIEAAALQTGEDSGLSDERVRLSNSEQLARLTEDIISALDEPPDERSSASDLLGRAAEAAGRLAKIDPGTEDFSTQTQSLAEGASELARYLRDYRDSVEHNPRRLDEIEERLSLINSLKQKYGGTIDSILEHGQSAQVELENLTHAEERIQELESELAKQLEKLSKVGRELSEVRRQAGDDLSKLIESELRDLKMDGAQFKVGIQWNDDADGLQVDERVLRFDATGIDEVEFLVEPNPGEGLKPLTKTASGGETSRLMLGLKSVLAQADRTPTLIFDEIDQGIGGRVGGIVGQKLLGLAEEHQVLCVTHLPQLAAFGDQHFKVDKEVVQERTVTRTQDLSNDERIPELALMLGGRSEPNLESASELLDAAQRLTKDDTA